MFLRDLINDGHVTVKYLPTRLMVADLFTKPLKWIKFNEYRDAIGVRLLNSPRSENLRGVCVEGVGTETGEQGSRRGGE